MVIGLGVMLVYVVLCDGVNNFGVIFFLFDKLLFVMIN